MNKIYVSPTTLIVDVNVQSALMNISQFDTEIDGNNAGLVKGDRSADHSRGSRSDYNVWNDDWSNN